MLTCHGMYSFEHDQFGFLDVHFLQHLLQMFWVVMTEDVFRLTTVPDTLDQGGMVSSVREDLNS